MCHLKKLIVREKNLKNNLDSRTADKVKEEGWSSRSSGLVMQSQNQEVSKTHRSRDTRCQTWQFHAWATGPTAHGSCSQGRQCPPHRQPCPQHRAWAASGQILALASSLTTTKGSEPTAIWGINSVKRPFHRGLEQERGKNIGDSGQPRDLIPGTFTRLLRPSGSNWGDQSSNRVLEVEAEHGNLRVFSPSANLF